eukprot:scaffold1452_cov96-Skeletonema_menzelii.AAC.7
MTEKRVRDREGGRKGVQWRSQDKMKTLVDVEKKEIDISFMLDSFEHRKKRVIITFTSLQLLHIRADRILTLSSAWRLKKSTPRHEFAMTSHTTTTYIFTYDI